MFFHPSRNDESPLCFIPTLRAAAIEETSKSNCLMLGHSPVSTRPGCVGLAVFAMSPSDHVRLYRERILSVHADHHSTTEKQPPVLGPVLLVSFWRFAVVPAISISIVHGFRQIGSVAVYLQDPAFVRLLLLPHRDPVPSPCHSPASPLPCLINASNLLF